MATSQVQPMPWWVRAFLIVSLLEALLIGLSGFFAPAQMTIPIAVSPLNGRFIAALYLAGACALTAAALARAVIDARIVLVAVGVATASLLVLSIVYWSTLGSGLVVWVWMLTYIADPIVALVAIAKFDLWRAAQPGRHRLTPLFVALAGLLGLTGLVLVLLPGVAVDYWPWAMTTILARLYSVFFLGYALCSLLCAFEARSQARRAMRLSYAALGPLVLVASVQHLDRFKDGLPTWLWFVGFAIPTLAVLGSMLPGWSDRPGRPLASAADLD